MRCIWVFMYSTLITAFLCVSFQPLRAQYQQGPYSPARSLSGNCSFSYGSSLQLSPSAETHKSDDVYATASHCACCDANSACLKVDSFGFSIPSAAVITGIIVEIEKRASPGSNIQDNGLRLLKNGVETGSNMAQGAVPWPYTDTYVSYGGCNNLWGAAWTPDDINSPGFGLYFANIDYTCGGITTSYIDHIRITVCYDVCMPAVSAAFTYSSSLLTLNCTDQSAGANLLLWDFGDGNSSMQQNPQHIYTDTGTYNVCLYAIDSCGADTFCTQVQMQCPQPDAGFTHTNTAFGVTFGNVSSGADTYTWDFGDGETSAEQTPTHVYANAGTYLVCLKAVNSCGADSVCTNVQVAGDASLSGTTTANVSLYPNPAGDFIYIRFSGKALPAALQIEVYDMWGRAYMLPRSQGSDSELRIDVSVLRAGMYRIKIYGEGMALSRSFIVL